MSGVITATNLQTTNIKNTSGTTYNFIKQVVQPAKLSNTGSSTQTTPTGNATWSDTGLTAAITPSSSSSKVLIFCNGLFYLRRNEEIRFRFMRDSTAILTMCGYAETSDGFFTMTAPSGYMDSPSTTSATTYKLQFYAQSEYASMRFNYSGTSSLGEASITLLEVAG
tara:strand:+ start:380 stop:880 length:501 start_codon:yes stop_codon:yes gene_type:complete